MRTRPSPLAFFLRLLAIIPIMSCASRVLAATITVTSTADSGIGSLRDAVSSANSGDTVVLNIAGPITVATPITISQNLQIRGPGTISGGGDSRVFTVSGTFSVTISNVDIDDGFAEFSEGGGIVNNGTLSVRNATFSNDVSELEGGAIFNSGTLTVTNSTFENDCGDSTLGCAIFNNGTLTATNSNFLNNNFGNCQGAGIYNAATATVTGSLFSGNDAFVDGGGITNEGTLIINKSSFAGNTASSPVGGLGGAIANSGTLNVTNSTFAENSVGLGVAGVSEGGAISNFGALTVTNSTFFDNSSFMGGAISPGGAATITESTFFENYGGAIVGSASLKGVILAGSVSNPNCSGTIIDEGYNISDDASCVFSATGSLNGADPQLDPNELRNNGGPTETIALLSTSPAVDAIPMPSCTDQSLPPIAITTDQRGVARPDVGESACDIGAYELVDVPLSKNDCKDGKWKLWSNPPFKNQGQCIKFVNHS
jgi:hypothetical protein